MRKSVGYLVVLWILVCLAGCNALPEGVDPTRPVMETEGVCRITFFDAYGPRTEKAVPEEHLEEICDWLGTFTIGEEAEEKVLPPGSNSICVRLQYADGSVAEHGLSTINVGEKVYFLKHGGTPECWFEVFGE